MEKLKLMFEKIRDTFTKINTGRDLKSKVARSSFWMGGAGGLEQGLRFLRNMILTRLLAPEAFGLMAIVLAFSTFFDSLTAIGIRQAIIQNDKGEDRKYLNGAWWLSFVRSAVLYFLAFIGAPFISKFYGNPELILLMRVAFLSILLKGIMSPRGYVAIKQLNFKRWVIIENGGGILGVMTAVILAYVIQNVWAIVIGFTVEAASRFVLSYIICPFLPGIVFRKESLRDLLKYARGMLGLPILTFIFMRADVFVLGKLVSQAELGLYSMAVTLASIPSQLVLKLFGQIVMPTFVAMQSDNERLNNALLKITSGIIILCFPLLIFSIFYGKYFLHVVYGEIYAQVAVPFAIICSTLIIKVSSAPIASLYFATGNPQHHRFFVAIRAFLIIAIIYPAIKWFGLNGAASAGFVSMFISYVLQVRRLQKMTSLNLREYLIIFLKGAGISLFIPLFWIILHNSLELFNPFFNIICGFLSCFISYGLGIRIFFKSKKSI